MSGQRHLVARQVLELHVSPGTDAMGLFDEMTDLFRERLAPILERCLDDLCPPGEMVRLDTLEVDLGTIRSGPGALADAFTPALSERLGFALRAALATEIRRHGTREANRSGDLELLDVFARSGVLPWWGDIAVAVTPADAFARAVGAEPMDVAELLRRLPAPAQDRLLRVVTDADLELLVAAVTAAAPARATTVAADVALFRAIVGAAIPPYRGKDSAEPSLAVRHGLLAVVVAAENGAPPRMWEAALLAAAATAGVTLGRLVSAGKRLTPAPESPAGDLRAVVDALATGDAALPHVRTPPGPVPEASVTAAPDSVATTEQSSGLPDDIAVTDAGLVVLSPFLVHFLARMGLLDPERRELRDERARSRAMAVLGYLTRMEDAAEHQLPLAKVLCGVDPAAAFDPGSGVTPPEADECQLLLSSVAAHLDATGDLDAEELRTRILLRSGVLSRRDGTWLLRVLPDPADRMLAGLPWSFEWVRLPWMPIPLVVEWPRDEWGPVAR